MFKVTLALLALALPGMVSAQSTSKAPAPATVPVPQTSTAGCLLVSNAFAKHATQEKERTLAQSVLYFYIGRISDRTSLDQLRTELEQQGQALTSTNATPLMNACLREMEMKAQLLQNAAEQLQRGKAR